MFRGFNLEITHTDFSEFYQHGLALYKIDEGRVLAELDSFISPEGVIDASKMEDEWFPQIKADIFLSHSHKDRELAISFAGWLHMTFGIETFIDSCIWGYSDSLLRKIDNRFCWDENRKVYSYEKRNRSTSHVNMMLSTALSKMIDNTECLIFLNTPKSVKNKDAVLTTTNSPWLYSEISISNMIRKKIPKRLKTTPAIESFSKGGKMVRLNENLEMEFTLKSVHLTKINDSAIDDWEKKFNDLTHFSWKPIDILYNSFPIDLSIYK